MHSGDFKELRNLCHQADPQPKENWTRMVILNIHSHSPLMVLHTRVAILVMCHVRHLYLTFHLPTQQNSLDKESLNEIIHQKQ